MAAKRHDQLQESVLEIDPSWHGQRDYLWVSLHTIR